MAVSWPEDWQQRLIDALTRAGADRECPRCGHENFQLMDGYISLPIQARLGDGPVGNVSHIATVCERCGYLALHVASVLLAAEIDATPGPDDATPNGAPGQAS